MKPTNEPLHGVLQGLEGLAEVLRFDQFLHLYVILEAVQAEAVALRQEHEGELVRDVIVDRGGDGGIELNKHSRRSEAGRSAAGWRTEFRS